MKDMHMEQLLDRKSGCGITRIIPYVIIIDCTDEEAVKQADQINGWLRKFSERAEAVRSMNTALCGRVLIVSDGIRVEYDSFGKLPRLELKANHGGSVYRAISIALDELEDIKNRCKKNGLHPEKPRLFILSMDREVDQPSDCSAAKRLRKLIKEWRICFFPISLSPVKIMMLRDLYPLKNSQDQIYTLENSLDDVFVDIDFQREKESLRVEEISNSTKTPPNPSCIMLNL